MKKFSLLYIAFALIVLLWTMNFIALSFYLYWTVWWFDNAMHFLAGFIGGSIVVWFFFDSQIFYRRFPMIYESILSAFLCVIVVGIAWEIFEYVNGLTQSTENYTLDTFLDMLFDALGAIFAGVIGAKEIFRKSTLPSR